MSDPWLFVVTLIAIAVTGGATVAFAVAGGGLRTRARDVVGTGLFLGLLLEGTFVVILAEHFLEQYKSH